MHRPLRDCGLIGDRHRAVTIVVALVALAGALRFAASLGALWHDEVWSLEIARSAGSPLALVTEMRHDNNHLLNSFLLRAFGDLSWEPMYRLPAVLAGVATVALSGVLARARGEVEARVAVALTGSSFLLVQYSSEARGYSLAVFFALLAFWCAERMATRRGWFPAAGFVACSILGFLSHLSFVHFYLAALLWTPFAFSRRAKSGPRLDRAVLVDLARCHALPILFVGVLYAVFIRDMEIGGGPIDPVQTVVLRVLALSAGAPVTLWEFLLPLAGLVTALGTGAAMVVLWRGKSDRIVFFFAVIVLAPSLIEGIFQPTVHFERYFLISATFLLLLLAELLAWAEMNGYRAAARIALVVMVAGNLWNCGRLIHEGRGDYRTLLATVYARTSGPEIRIGNDHPFRSMVLRHYSVRLGDPRPVRYQGMAGKDPPEWFVGHSQDPYRVPKTSFVHPPSGGRFVLVEVFPRYGLSGWRIFLYHLQGPEPKDELTEGR